MTSRSRVAGLTIRLTLVAEAGRCPGAGVVAGRALPAVVTRWARVAGLAIRLTLMAEAGALPGTGCVAG